MSVAQRVICAFFFLQSRGSILPHKHEQTKVIKWNSHRMSSNVHVLRMPGASRSHFRTLSPSRQAPRSVPSPSARPLISLSPSTLLSPMSSSSDNEPSCVQDHLEEALETVQNMTIPSRPTSPNTQSTNLRLLKDLEAEMIVKGQIPPTTSLERFQVIAESLADVPSPPSSQPAPQILKQTVSTAVNRLKRYLPDDEAPAVDLRTTFVHFRQALGGIDTPHGSQDHDEEDTEHFTNEFQYMKDTLQRKKIIVKPARRRSLRKVCPCRPDPTTQPNNHTSSVSSVSRRRIRIRQSPRTTSRPSRMQMSPWRQVRLSPITRPAQSYFTGQGRPQTRRRDA